MSTLIGPRYVRYREAYLMMASRADYRPQAPSDGMGHILLTREQVADKGRLEQEATAYALAFNKQEDTLSFRIGCSDFRTNRAFIWTIEAARALAGGTPDLALDLLDMVIEEIKRQCPDASD